jgi:hypothetical protein
MQMLVGLVTFCSAAAALRFLNIFTPFCLRISKPHSYEYFSIRQSTPATYANPHCWRVAQNAYLGFSRIERIPRKMIYLWGRKICVCHFHEWHAFAQSKRCQFHPIDHESDMGYFTSQSTANMLFKFNIFVNIGK